MIITNKYNLPKQYVKLVSARQGFRKGLHVSDLLTPIRVSLLKKRHYDEIQTDVCDWIASLTGQAWHSVMEEGAGLNSLPEESLRINIAGEWIYGRPDLYDGDEFELIDYKTTSVWKKVFGIEDFLKDCYRQLNIYAVILRELGFKVAKLRVDVKYTDWKKSESERKSDYPAPIEVYRTDPEPDEKVREWLDAKVREYQSFREVADNDLPVCTPEERWSKKDVYAVKKVGLKKALKLHETEKDAKSHLEALGDGYAIEKRPGEDIRCASYCPQREFCSYWKEHGAEQGE